MVVSRFADTTAVVTGASSGIGRAIAIALANSGVEKLLIHFRENQAGADQTALAARECGCEASTFAADLSLSDDIGRLAEVAFDRLGTIDTWVNNAGADVLTGPANELDFDEKLQRLFSVDVTGTISLSRQVSHRMAGQRSAGQRSERPSAMVFIGWDQAQLGMEGDAGQMFGPVKAAVMAYAASLAQTLAPHVRVNTIAPGWIMTDWGESAGPHWDARAKAQSLMDRWGRPEDIANAVLYVADPGNTFLTGQTINLNGGWNRRYC